MQSSENSGVPSTLSPADSVEIISISEEEKSLHSLDQIAKEVRQMIQSLNDIELKLKSGVPNCPRHIICDDAETELGGSPDENVRKVQSNTKKLQYQIEELFDCSKGARLAMIQLEKSLDNLEHQMDKANCQTAAIESIKLQMDLDGSRCQQRYKHLRKLCFNWNRGYDDAKYMRKVFGGIVRRLYTKEAYREEKREVFKKLRETEVSCLATREELMRQAKHMKGLVNVFIESEPLCNSAASLALPQKSRVAGTDHSSHVKRVSNEIATSVSVSTGLYDRMSSMIKLKSELSRRN